MNDGFNGFSIDTIQFLRDLSMNNAKSWFDEHRDDYKNNLLKPMQELVEALKDTMLHIDTEFETRPLVDKTISRIYRDIRFSDDKSPYRTNIWITFKRHVDNWKDSPVFFFELMLDSYRYGMGYYQASTETMTGIRKKIDTEPKKFLKIIEPINNNFVLGGESYKKSKKTINTLIDDYYNKKSFYLTLEKELDDLIFSRNLVSEIKNGFKILTPLYHFLCDIVS